MPGGKPGHVAARRGNWPLPSRNHAAGGQPPAGSSGWPATRWPWPGHSSGPEPYPAMAAVTERLVGRCAAPAQRHPRVLPDQRVVLTEDRDVAADEQRAVRALLYRSFLRHWLLRAAVQAAEVQRARGTALDHLADLAGRSVVHDDPRPALVVENSGESAQAFGGMDTERGLPGDLDLVVRVRTLDRRRVARLLAETLRSLIGLIVRWIARSFGHL